ncbi:MAG: cadmium-translocating P-type ATPase [Erysipelotrichaceae bacterium]|nr:cadmium-translocating P-type ATPase [Erysipelotrichaceae bacterium]
MTKKQKKMLLRISIALVAYGIALAAPLPELVQTILFLCIYIYISYDILKKAVTNIGHGQVFDENFLMAVASLGALALGEYSESCAVVLFYQIGEWFQSYAVNRSRQSIADLMDICPDYACIEVNGTIEQVDPEEVSVGDIIVIQPGEKIPLDGIVTKGTTILDTSALTGESIPRQVTVGDEVISGCINQSGVVYAQVTKEFEDSTVSKILEMVENASDRKSKSEDFITKFARFYTPIVVFSALALAVIPSLVTGNWGQWIYRALTFLVISCPCALVISVPLSFFGGIGAASRRGILVKGSNYLEALSQVTRIVFDKTGTLTKGNFKVTQIHVEKGTQDELLELVAKIESFSNHPISKSIKEMYGKSIDTSDVDNVQEIAGHGICATVGAVTYYVGNTKLMTRIGRKVDEKACGLGTVIYVCSDNEYLGYIEIADEIKENAKQAIHNLKASGIQKTIMLTGDSRHVAEAVAEKLDMDEVHAQLLPTDKVDCVETLLKKGSEKEKLAFVGDGINDAPVLTRSDVGIAMGALGSDAAIEAADIVLMDDDPASIATAIRISHKTLKIVHQNIVFSIAVKVLVLILGALGLTGMWAAVFADVGVAFLAILNAMRCMNVNGL